MSKIIASTLGLLFLTILVSGQGVQKDKKLPDVTIEDLQGKKVDLQQYSENDSVTVLSFWATWCSPCKKELSNLSKLNRTWEKKYNTEIVAISIDDSRNSAKVKSYVNGQNWPFDVLLDKNQDAQRALNFQTVPYTVLVDEKGHIVYTRQGYVPGDEYELEDKIKKFSEEDQSNQSSN